MNSHEFDDKLVKGFTQELDLVKTLEAVELKPIVIDENTVFPNEEDDELINAQVFGECMDELVWDFVRIHKDANKRKFSEWLKLLEEIL